MITKQKLILTSFFLLFVCLAWVPSSVFSQSVNAQVKAGHIVVGSGRLVARAADGTERRLRRRAAVYAGDTIVVGKNAFVQIRFTDGGLFSLRPDSEFKVSEYRHQEQETENGKVVFELLKGGLRTISGSIGKKDKENYQLKTPVSTIGIRGTHYGVRLCTGNCTSPQGDPMPDGLYGGVVDGAISVKNQSGEGIIGNDQYFHVGAMDAPLQQLLGPPGVVFDPAVDGQIVEGEPQAGEGSLPPEDEPLTPLDPLSPLLGDSEILDLQPLMDQPFDPLTATSTTQTLTSNLTPAPLWSGVVMAVNDGRFGADAMMGGQKDLQNPEIFIDANNNLIHIEHYGAADCQPCIFDKGTATLTNTGSLPILGDPNKKIYWGRWEGGWYGQDSAGGHTGQGSWHFMYSPNVTTRNVLDTLQVNNATATFSQWSPGDGTAPTDELGNTGFYFSAPSVDINFGTRTASNYQVGITIPATSVSFSGIQVTDVNFNGPGFEIPLDVTCSGCAVVTGSGNPKLMFVGNATHIMNSIEMNAGDQSVVGTAVLTDDSL